MSKRYGLYGDHAADFLTWGGRIIWHDNAAELAYLVPVGTTTVREIPRDVPDALMMPLREHPQLATVRWPLTRDQFRRPH